MEVTLTAEDAPDWTYRGEGGANLVLGYTGSSPLFSGKVLRVQKVPRGKGAGELAGSDGGAALVLSEHERLLWNDVDQLAECASKDEAGRLFVLHVMSPLLGSEHVDTGIHISVSREFLVSIEEKVADQRPASRIDASKINTQCGRAILMSDHSVLQHAIPSEDICISVEIKPKCGFLPSSEFMARGNAVKTHVTRFRMHQVLKLHQREILLMSGYDPLDLFSGSRDRINHAIRALFATPQNNFRVFLNGSIIFGDLGGGVDKAESAADETRERNDTFEDSIKDVIQAEHGLRLATFQKLVSEAIFKSRILNRLLEAQKLDTIDIEGAIHAYYNIISQPCLVCKSLNDTELFHKYSFLHSLPLEKSMRIVKEYLIAATAKDCSLMISFKLRGDAEEPVECDSVFLESTNQQFNYKASFIDLDMKPLKKMVYYYELDRKIVDLYCKLGEIKGSGSKTSTDLGIETLYYPNTEETTSFEGERVTQGV